MNNARITIAILLLLSPLDILGEKVSKYTKLNKDKRKFEENDNYIIVKYGNQTIYNARQFKNEYRQDVDYIKYKGNTVDLTQQFTIEKNGIIEIYFSKKVLSLKNFFYDYSDPNVEYISSINLKYFDSSSLESLESTFYGCISLESIDLSTFNAPSLTNMAQTFFHCSSLKTLDLSNIKSSSIINTNRMLCGCESLLHINMNNLDLSNVKDSAYMFYNMKKINCLEINGLKDNDKINDEFNREYGLNGKNNLTICKNEDNLPIEKPNYIICKYGIRTEYPDGFQNKYRKNISYIKYRNSIVGPSETLIIEANTSIEIYFSEPITSLYGFFSAGVNKDPKTQNITSIDLSHFDSSFIEDTAFMFYNCSSLEEINFENFNTSRVTSMMRMFNSCSNLKSLDLSIFNTSKVTDMNSMFSSCSNLKSLNLSIFDTSKVVNLGYMLYSCTSLEYLDISNFNISQTNDIEFIFNNASSIKYINFYNAQIGKIMN